MKQIVIVGSGGAGKTRLARALGERLGLSVIHLDRHYWRPGWKGTPREVWRARERELLSGDAWIADGNYWNTLEMRLERADTLIFLDLPRLLCTWRVLKRVFTYRPGSRPDMAEGCPERVSLPFLRWVWTYPEKQRPKILGILDQHRTLRVVHLKSDRDVVRLLEEVARA